MKVEESNVHLEAVTNRICVPSVDYARNFCDEPLTRKENIMSKIKTFIKKHPVLTYFALTFAISWVGLLLVSG